MKKHILLFLSCLMSLSARADFQFYLKEKQFLQPLAGPPVAYKELIFPQNVDHFSGGNKTFKQRYWYSNTMAKASSAPVMVYICGEGACGGGVLYGPISAHARVVGAHLFAIEHRYYGKSQPFADLSTENLKFLSTAQALADLVSFKRSLQRQMNLSGPWILVGGSYAGNLAAYARSQFPEEFFASLASSAPVMAKQSFTEFDRHVASIAGEQCSRTTQMVLAEIEDRIQTDQGFLDLRNKFSAPSIEIKRDFIELLSDITSAAMFYGMRDEFCKNLAEKGLDGYVQMKLKVDQKVADFSKYATKKSEDISLAAHGGSLGMRQWYYQSCTEYGYWQNANPGFSMRSKLFNQQAQDELCQRLFGLPGASSVEGTNDKYYRPLVSQAQSHILMTNGTRDPWKYLSVLDSQTFHPQSQIDIELIDGALHCEDISMGGSPAVRDAKIKFQNLLKTWLQNIIGGKQEIF